MTAKQIIGGVVAGLVVTGAIVGTGEALSAPSSSPVVPWTTTEPAVEPTTAPEDHWTEPEPTYTPPEPALSWEDQVYLDVLDAEDIYYASDADAIAVAHSICDGLHAGLTSEDVGDAVMTGGGYSPYDAGYIVGASWATYCPEAPL